MTHRLHLARHPSDLTALQPLIIRDFLDMAHKGQRTCLRAVIEMCTDLHQHGMECRFLKPFGGAVYELKKRATDGGARVYLFRLGDDFVLVHSECKNENKADPTMLLDILDIIEALQNDQPVLDTKRS